MRKKIFLVHFGLFLVTLAFGQDSLRTTMLQEVVVSATRTEQPVIETPRSVTVINREAIVNSVYHSVGELLSFSAGLYVVGANQTPGTNQSLFMRGAASNQVVVMVDGIRITDPSSPNAAIDLSELSLTNVERVEIIRGSHSTLFGGAAIGGVVNIITRKNQDTGFHGDASVQAGTFGNGSSAFTESIDLNYSMQGGFYVNGSLFQQNVNGLDASLQNNTSGSFSTADEDDFRKSDGFVKAGFRNNTWDSFVAYKKTNQQADIDRGAFADDENNVLDFERDLLEYRIGYTFNPRWSAALLGSWSSSQRINEDDSSVVSSNGEYDHSYFKGDYTGKLQTHEIQLNYQSEKIKGLLGAGLYQEDMFFDTRFFYKDPFFSFESVTDYDTLDTRASTGYVFGQLNYSISKFNISLGSRLSNHSLADNYWTVEFNPSYRVDNTLLYASLSTGYNAPSLYQLYDPTRGFDAYTSRGNKELKAEESLSLEAGIKREFSNAGFLTLSAFRTSVKNSIEYIYLWNGFEPIAQLDFDDYRGDTYVNIARQESQGIELEGYAPIGKKIAVNANLSLLNGKAKINAADISTQQTGGNHVQLYNFGSFLTGEYEDDDLTRRPNVMGFAELRYRPVPSLALSTAWRHAGSRVDVAYDFSLGPFGALKQSAVKAYSLFDFGVNWQASKIFSIAFKVENLLDENYAEIAGFRTRGRSGYLKLAARW